MRVTTEAALMISRIPQKTRAGKLNITLKTTHVPQAAEYSRSVIYLVMY